MSGNLGGGANIDADGGWWGKGQCQLLDLDALAFQQGNLPTGSTRFTHKGPTGSTRFTHERYKEIHVPATECKPLDPTKKLIKISEMPEWPQSAFKGMTHLIRVQSRVYKTAIDSGDNILLCGLSGAGKTNVAVLTILQQLALNRNDDGSFNHKNYKIVYAAPIKALVAEVVANLSNRLQIYGVNVRELSGDQTLTLREIEETQVIVTTPENWEIITRKSGDCTYSLLAKLLIIDEIHLLHHNRGPLLESIVARTVRQVETTNDRIRLVGLSANIPNYYGVACFYMWIWRKVYSILTIVTDISHLINSILGSKLRSHWKGLS